MTVSSNDGCKGGCCIVPIGFFLLFSLTAKSVPLFIFAVAVVFMIWMAVTFNQKKPTTVEPVILDVAPPPLIEQRLREIRERRDSILALLQAHRDHPMLGAMDLEIRAETEEIAKEAERIAEAKNEVLRFLSQSDATDDQIRRLEYQVATETDPRIRDAVHATLESTRSEMDNVRRLSEQVRYFEALLTQAEATLAELHTRIGLSLTQTGEYTDPRSRLALAEASGELKNVSEAMRQTLNELGDA